MRDTMTREILPRYERKQGATLPALHMIQHEYGWVPPQAMMEIADFLGLKPADVIDTASFYEEYWMKPKGQHLIAVCRSIASRSCKWYSPCTPSRSCPGQPNLLDWEPRASSSLS